MADCAEEKRKRRNAPDYASLSAFVGVPICCDVPGFRGDRD